MDYSLVSILIIACMTHTKLFWLLLRVPLLFFPLCTASTGLVYNLLKPVEKSSVPKVTRRRYRSASSDSPRITFVATTGAGVRRTDYTGPMLVFYCHPRIRRTISSLIQEVSFNTFWSTSGHELSSNTWPGVGPMRRPAPQAMRVSSRTALFINVQSSLLLFVQRYSHDSTFSAIFISLRVSQRLTLMPSLVNWHLCLHATYDNSSDSRT